MRTRIALIVVASAACGPATAPFVEGLPVATLTCPSAEPGVPFTVSGTATPGYTAVSLLVASETVAALEHTLTVANASVVSATLTVTSGANIAEATCRVVVGDPSVVVPGVPPPQPADRDLSGVFAFVADERPQLTDGGLNPPQQCPANPLLALVEMQQNGNEVTMSMRYCEVNVPDVDLGFPLGIQHTEATASVAQGLPVVGPVTFALNGDEFAPPLDVLGRGIVAGASLDNPDSDELPATDTDARLARDGDKPGVQIVVNGLTLNVVYRRWLRAFHGSIVSSNDIDGSTEGSFVGENEVALLTDFFDNTMPSGVALPSTFSMKRIDGQHDARNLTGADGVLDCNDVIEASDDLLGELATLGAPEGCAVIEQD